MLEDFIDKKRIVVPAVTKKYSHFLKKLPMLGKCVKD